MSKLDILTVMVGFLLRIAFLILQFASPLADYWLNPFVSSRLCHDVASWCGYIGLELSMWVVYVVYCIAEHAMVLPYRIPGVSILYRAVVFWVSFYLSILRDPGGRSIIQILSDPTYSQHGPSRISRKKSKAERRDQPSRSPTRFLRAALTPAYRHDPLGLARVHDNLLERQPTLPQNRFLWVVATIVMTGITGWIIASGVARLQLRLLRRRLGLSSSEGEVTHSEGVMTRSEGVVPAPSRLRRRRTPRGSRWQRLPVRSRKKGRKRAQMRPRRHTCLANSLAEDSNGPVNFDSDGITFIIDNSATVIMCNDRSMFPGELRKVRSAVETAYGVGVSTYVGTIRIRLTTDEGISMTYDIEGAVYDPKSNFNILGVPCLAAHFAKDELGDQAFEGDQFDEGTHIHSRATRSTLTWDHGKHQRSFMHGTSNLPELALNTGEGYFQAFCTRVEIFYRDKIHYAFSSSRTFEPEDELDDEDLETMVFEDQDEPQVIGDFELGTNLVYTDGQGGVESVVYEGESSTGSQHVVRRADGSTIFVYSSNLKLQDQTDLTSLPTTPLDYCKEVGKTVTKKEASRLAYPQQLSPLQQELLSWHFRLHHLPFWRIFLLCEAGYLPKRLLKCKGKEPLCVACQFGQAHRRPWRVKGKKSGSIRDGKESKPGEGTSVDQIVSAQPGLVPIMEGDHTTDRIWGATAFCDHVSNFVYVHLMRNFTLEETLMAKKAYEKVMAQAGWAVKAYRGDNGRFADAGWLQACNEKDQTPTYCGVGAHHQNGIIENRIKQLTNTARTLLLHAMRMWPGMIDTMFWPFALKAAADRINALHLNPDGKSTPESKLHNVELSDLPVKNFQTLFCPVYVLDHRLHQAGSIGPPKWEPRSRVGIYMGHSPFHAGNVALVFNIKTGRVSPQYHVVFDSDFTTVPFMERGEEPPNWADLCQYSSESFREEAVSLADEWLSTSKTETIDQGTCGTRPPNDVVRSSAKKGAQPPPFSPVVPQAVMSPSEPHRAAEGGSSAYSWRPHEEEAKSPTTGGAPKKRVRFADQPTTGDTPMTGQLKLPERINLSDVGRRRSKRIQEQKEGHKAKKAKAHVTFGSRVKGAISMFALVCNVAQPTMPCHPISPTATFYERCINRFDEANELIDGTLNEMHLFAFAAKTGSNETYTFRQVLNQPDLPDFITAMEKEIRDHEERGHWTIVERSSIPATAKTIKAIWSFKRKRFPDGRLNKHKARLCAHGGMQKWGENYWETTRRS